MSMATMAQLITWLEYLGGIAFAAAGALVGIRKHMDIFGVMVLGLTTATAGGVLRDLILGITPPAMFRNPTYALVAMATAVLIFLKPVRKILKPESPVFDLTLFLADTLGLAIFTVVGVRTAIAAYPSGSLFLQVFLGVVSAVGGGVLRDMMAGVPPYIFTKHVYATSCVAGALVCGLMWKISPVWSMAVGFFLVVLIRCLASHFRWNLPHS